MVVFAAFDGSDLYAQLSKSSELLRSKEKGEYIFIAAHRGDWQYAPENSTLSLQHNIFWGIDIMETDVHLTKDDQLVIMHDTSIDRCTNGTGEISSLTLEEIKKYHLVNNINGNTDLQVPTLEEFLQLAKGKVMLYLDKAGLEKPGTPTGYKIKKIREVLRKYDMLEETIFVLSYPYSQAKELFGDDLEKVIYVPAIEDGMTNLSAYVDEYLEKLHPIAFQFRMHSLNGEAHQQLPKILQSTSKAFIAATWPNHTANHDDYRSLFERPSAGWGWLIENGFCILETNYPKDLLDYLNANHYR